LAAALRVPSEADAWALEKAVKARLSGCRFIGDWFNAHPDDVIRTAFEAAAELGSVLVLERQKLYRRGDGRGGARPGAGRPRKAAKSEFGLPKMPAFPR
jgi:hypothetical protein